MKMGIVAFSLALSLFSLILLRAKPAFSINKKVLLMYAHIVCLVFPLFFYLFFNGCASFLSSCSTLKTTLYLIILTGITAAILGAILAPLLFLKLSEQKSRQIHTGRAHTCITHTAEAFGITSPRVYVLNTAHPLAFSSTLFGRRDIFISAGMADLLTERELEAVLLHELGHIKNASSRLKFSALIMRLFSPAYPFMSLHTILSCDERSADQFAATCQKTARHIDSAKRTLAQYVVQERE